MKVHDTIDIKLKNGSIIKGFYINSIRNGIIKMVDEKCQTVILIDHADIDEIIERIDLLNCPFCGNEVTIKETHSISGFDTELYISCCSIMKSGCKQTLIEKWNRRG